MRAVLDPNVVISAALSPLGTPAQLVFAWLQGDFELVASLLLIEELERVLRYPKIRKRIDASEAAALVDLILRHALVAEDAEPESIRSSDPGDDYLIGLAQNNAALLVSGDKHLLKLQDDLPVLSPVEFLKNLPR